jgi:hypothetical protein
VVADAEVGGRVFDGHRHHRSAGNARPGSATQRSRANRPLCGSSASVSIGEHQVHELMWSRNQQARLSSGPYGLGTKTPRFTAIARHGGSPRKRPHESVSATSLRSGSKPAWAVVSENSRRLLGAVAVCVLFDVAGLRELVKAR